jgi:hypothetical protein
LKREKEVVFYSQMELISISTAGKKLNCKVTVIVPESTPPLMRERLCAEGASGTFVHLSLSLPLQLSTTNSTRLCGLTDFNICFSCCSWFDVV